MEPNDVQLKLYTLLVEQLHKYVTVFWQFPLALLVTNFLAADKFLQHPPVMFLLALIDCVFVYAFHRLVKNSDDIILALKKAEQNLKRTAYVEFIPEFHPPKVRAPRLTVLTLWAFVIGLALFSGVKTFF
jgi:hypothetical protein